MKRGSHSKFRLSKGMLLMLALVLVVGVSVGGTLAWLTAKSNKVENTFTSAALFENPETDFTLWEHEAKDEDKDGQYELNETEVQANEYDILPGVAIPKDPTVDIVGLQEHAYLYITVEGTLPSGMTYEIDPDNWEKLPGYNGVYVYRGVYAADNVIKPSVKDTFTVNILKDKEISVGDGFEGSNGASTLSFKAYMVQATGNGDSAAEAWANTYDTP